MSTVSVKRRTDSEVRQNVADNVQINMHSRYVLTRVTVNNVSNREVGNTNKMDNELVRMCSDNP